MDAPLTKSKEGGLWDASSPVVSVLLYIYQMENFVYRELNHSSRFKDHSKVKTLGPYAKALLIIIAGA